MIKKIRSFINENRMYAWMIVFIIFIQTFSAAMHSNDFKSFKNSSYQREQFAKEVKLKEQALREILLNDSKASRNFGFIFLLALGLLVVGVFFLAYYISKRRESIDIIPRTLNAPGAAWSLPDVLKVVMLFVFFHSLFSIVIYILGHLFLASLWNSRFDMVLSTVLMDLLALFFILRVVTLKYHQSVEALGISFKNIFQNIRVGLYSYIAFLPILAVLFFLVIAIARLLNYVLPPQPVYELLFKEDRPIMLVFVSFLIALLGPVIEEVFFRGFLYGALKKSLGVALAVIISGFLFSFLHINLLGFIPIMALGVFLAYMRERTGSLIPSITVHIVHNSAITMMMFFIRDIMSKAA